MGAGLVTVNRLIILFALLAACGCSEKQSAAILDVTKTNTLVLTPKGGHRGYLRLHIHGHLDGSATVASSWFQEKTFSNSVEFRQEGDFYDTNCVLVYSPVHVRNGTMRVDYEFK